MSDFYVRGFYRRVFGCYYVPYRLILGLQVADSDKVSMRLKMLKSGRVVISVTVVAPSNVIRFGHKGVFKDSVSVEIFDELKIMNDLSQPMLFAPSIKYRMKTNKDRVGIFA